MLKFETGTQQARGKWKSFIYFIHMFQEHSLCLRNEKQGVMGDKQQFSDPINSRLNFLVY